jgi:hypothetical protein
MQEGGFLNVDGPDLTTIFQVSIGYLMHMRAPIQDRLLRILMEQPEGDF